MTQMQLFGAYLPKQTPFSLTLPQRRLQSYVQPIVATVNSLAKTKKSFRPFLKIALFNFLIFLKLFIVGTIGRSMHSPFLTLPLIIVLVSIPFFSTLLSSFQGSHCQEISLMKKQGKQYAQWLKTDS